MGIERTISETSLSRLQVVTVPVRYHDLWDGFYFHQAAECVQQDGDPVRAADVARELEKMKAAPDMILAGMLGTVWRGDESELDLVRKAFTVWTGDLLEMQPTQTELENRDLDAVEAKFQRMTKPAKLILHARLLAELQFLDSRLLTEGDSGCGQRTQEFLDGFLALFSDFQDDEYVKDTYWRGEYLYKELFVHYYLAADGNAIWQTDGLPGGSSVFRRDFPDWERRKEDFEPGDDSVELEISGEFELEKLWTDRVTGMEASEEEKKMAEATLSPDEDRLSRIQPDRILASQFFPDSGAVIVAEGREHGVDFLKIDSPEYLSMILPWAPAALAGDFSQAQESGTVLGPLKDGSQLVLTEGSLFSIGGLKMTDGTGILDGDNWRVFLAMKTQRAPVSLPELIMKWRAYCFDYVPAFLSHDWSAKNVKTFFRLDGEDLAIEPAHLNLDEENDEDQGYMKFLQPGLSFELIAMGAEDIREEGSYI